MPRELVDMVVSHLDNNDLAACCLVSHYWRLSALPELFHTFSVMVVKENSWGYRRTLDPPCDKNPLHISAFNGFLASPTSQDVRTFIKQLIIRGGQSDEEEELSIFELDAIIAKLPRLETLQLEVLLLSTPGTLMPPGWLNPRPLEMLALDRVSCKLPPWIEESSPHLGDCLRSRGDQCVFVELINLFSSIVYLELHDVIFDRDVQSRYGYYWEHDHLSQTIASSINPVLRIRDLDSRIRAINQHQGDVLAILMHSSSLVALKKLALGYDPDICRRTIRCVGPSLEVLSIVLPLEPSAVIDTRSVRRVSVVLNYIVLTCLLGFIRCRTLHNAVVPLDHSSQHIFLPAESHHLQSGQSCT